MRATPARLIDNLLDQKVCAIRTLVFEHAVDRVQPFASFLWIDIGIHVHGALLAEWEGTGPDRNWI